MLFLFIGFSPDAKVIEHRVHENPGVGPNSKNEILPGMVYTIEPGIYIEGWGGIRIEDMVLMTDNGNKLLSHAEKGSY